MKTYIVSILFDKSTIYQVDVRATSKNDAYQKAKTRLIRKLFNPSKLTRYSCREI